MRNENRPSPRRLRTDGQQRADRQLRSNGPSGSPQRSYQRYMSLAREAASVGDTIEMENWYQHAEHFFRMMRERTSPFAS
jgi:hypothetical protein